MISEFRRALLWIALNTVGAVAYLMLASSVWIEPGLRHQDVARGGAGVVWAVTALPVLIGFLIVDLVWLGLVVAKTAKTNSFRSASPLAAVAILWLCAIFLDLALR